MKQKKARLPYIVLAPLALLLLLIGGMRLLTVLTDDHETENNTPPASDRGPHRPLPPSAPTPPPKPADAALQKELEKTVRGQVEAFHKNDFAGALLFSEESFRSQWTADSFRSMIQARYNSLITAEKEMFERAQWNGAIATLPLTVQDHDGAETRFVYLLRSASTGKAWRVIGCQPITPSVAMAQEMPVTATRQSIEPRAAPPVSAP